MDNPLSPGPHYWEFPRFEVRDERTGVTTTFIRDDLHPEMNVYMKVWRPIPYYT